MLKGALAEGRNEEVKTNERDDEIETSSKARVMTVEDCSLRTADERSSLERLRQIHLNLVPRFAEGWNQQCLVTLRRQTISRILYYDWIYQKLLGKPGVICEFGVYWGATLATLQSLCSTYEPYNHQRKIFGFDTFSGFPSVHEKDGEEHRPGDFSVDAGYKKELEEILHIQEQQSPLRHIKKTHLVQGDVSITIHQWLEQNEGIAIGLAIFDLDLYKPTKDVLEAIKPRLYKGSVLVFDEFSHNNSYSRWPGETIAVDEVFGINNLRFEHYPHQPASAICILE